DLQIRGIQIQVDVGIRLQAPGLPGYQMLLESLDQIDDDVLTQGSLAQERTKSSLDSALIHPGEIERDDRRIELPRPPLIGGQKPALPFLGPSKLFDRRPRGTSKGIEPMLVWIVLAFVP